jgi:hypothetical protein
MLGFAVPFWLGPRASLPPPIYFQHDQQHYLEMANTGTTPQVPAPFAWRVLPPAIVRIAGLPADRGFHALTLISLALIPPTIAIMLAAAGVSTPSALILGVVSALAPPTTGYLSWDYIRPDGLSLLLIAASSWAAIRGRPPLFIVAIVALSLTKETWVIAAAFAVMWSRARAPGFWKWAVAGTLLALLAAVSLRLALPAPQSYSWIANLRDLYWPLDPRTIARRLLLATASTWTVLTPLAVFAIARRRRDPRAWAVAVPLAIATAQILVAIDTQRLVAAALPFVLLACAWDIDRLEPQFRVVAGAALAIAQIPWLLACARVWTPALRGIEIALVLAAAIAVIAALRCDDPSGPSAARTASRRSRPPA